MITIKKTYYAFMLATATFAQLSADSYRDYFVPEFSYNNVAVSSLTAREVSRDLYRAYRAHSIINTSADDQKKQEYIDAFKAIKSPEYLGHSYAYGKSSVLFQDYEWVTNATSDMSPKKLRSVFIARAIFKFISDYAVVMGIDNIYRLAPAQLSDMYKKFMNMIPQWMQSTLLNEVIKFTFKEVTIALIGYKVEPRVMALIFTE